MGVQTVCLHIRKYIILLMPKNKSQNFGVWKTHIQFINPPKHFQNDLKFSLITYF